MVKGSSVSLAEEVILNKIFVLRGKKIMFDHDLAEL
jgi:hypothetical protein